MGLHAQYMSERKEQLLSCDVLRQDINELRLKRGAKLVSYGKNQEFLLDIKYIQQVYESFRIYGNDTSGIDRIPAPRPQVMEQMVEDFSVPLNILQQNPKILQNHLVGEDRKPKIQRFGARCGYLEAIQDIVDNRQDHY